MDVVVVGVTLHVLVVVHILSIKLSPGDGTAIFNLLVQHAFCESSIKRPSGRYYLVGSAEVVLGIPGRTHPTVLVLVGKLSCPCTFLGITVLYN